MSLILDALRKSEAERRRGQAPSLYAETPVPTSALRPAWMPWLPVAGGVLVLVAVAVWFMRDSDAPVTKSELVEQSPSLVSAPAATNPGPQPAPMTTPEPAAPPPPAPPPGTTSPRATTPSVDALVKPPANPAAAAADAATSSSPQASVSPPDAGNGDKAAAEPAEDPVPPVDILDPSTRGALPPLKLSMHVYDPDPTRRFAIIDGQRVTEGAQMGNAIVLAIRRDGVLLDVGGRRVLLPRP
jgi:general secretion pathway protein B